MRSIIAYYNLKKTWAVSLANGLLRNFLRNKDIYLEKVGKDLEGKYAHPLWLIESIRETYPVQWEKLLLANNTHPPLTLRVNLLITSREDYLRRLKADGMGAKPLDYVSSGVILEKPKPIEKIPGFNEGFISVQDSAAQLASDLLDLKHDLKILDACAAPGGKACHILESEPSVKLTAVEIDGRRSEKIKENLNRLGLKAHVKTADVLDVDAWWDAEPFDRILCDAPCSSTGVIRRHPDIKLLRREKDIAKLVLLQQAMLKTLWPLLKEGGLLVYATCSVMAEENWLNVAEFLRVNPDAVEVKIDKPWGHEKIHGRQVLPGENQMDGFYYCCLRKK